MRRSSRALLLAVVGLLALPGYAQASEEGSISGSVTEAVGIKQPISGLCVTAYDEHSFTIRQVQTEGTGHYAIERLPAGEYVVVFHNCLQGTLNFAPQYYQGASEELQAKKITVTSGELGHPGINAEMQEGAKLEGVAVNGKGEGSANVCVVATPGSITSFPAVMLESGVARTNANGEYEIVGLASSKYVVEYSDCGADVVQAYYDESVPSGRTPEASLATEVPLTAGAGQKLKTVSLEAGGVIEGTITDTQGGVIDAPFCITAENVLPSAEPIFESTTNGRYRIHGLPTGQYRLVIEECREGRIASQWASQYYNGAHKAAEATLISVTAGIEPEVAVIANFTMVRADAIRPINTSTPVLSGTPVAGASLSCVNGTWLGKPTPTYTYVWLRDGAAIAGAKEGSYTVQTADEGHTLSCVVTATNEAGTATSTSNPLQVPVPERPPKEPPRLGLVSVKQRTGAIVMEVEFPEAGIASLSGVIKHGASIDRVVKQCAAGHHGTCVCRRRGARKRCVERIVSYGSDEREIYGAGIDQMTLKPDAQLLGLLHAGKTVVVAMTLTFSPAGTDEQITRHKTVTVHLRAIGREGRARKADLPRGPAAR